MDGRSAGALPYWRLAGWYFAYFASLGVLVPYWGLYLQSRGFDALAIGELMAILTGTKILAPMVWGHLVDASGKRMPLVRIACAAGALGFLLVLPARGFWSMAGAMLLFTFFWNAALPQMEAVTFNHLGPRVSRYARVRVWGSVGFILTVSVLGVLLERLSISTVPIWVGLLMAAIALGAFVVPDSPPARVAGAEPSLKGLLVRPETLALFSACFLMQMGHGTYYAFYSIHLKSAGYGSAAVGALWATGVISEVLVFLVMHRLLEGLGSRPVLLASLALAALRWLLIGAFVAHPVVQVLAQTLHAATFGTFHAAAIHLVHHYFPGRTQGRGQALYNSLSFGAGGAAGSLIGGLLWEGPGPTVAFAVGSLAALLGFLTVWRWVDLERRF